MRAVVTRVSSASVEIEGRVAGQIERGLLVLLGVGPDDTQADAGVLADRVCKMRIFPDAQGKMNVAPVPGADGILVISNFTLYGDAMASRRPSFMAAASPELAGPLYNHFVECCRAAGFATATGEFGADMQVTSVNDGPVTILLER